jgi:putative membrane protein
MSDEMAAPTSAAPPAATDHEFSSHHEEPLPMPMQNTSRKSTLSKSMMDVHVTGTQTPMSGMRHSHFEPTGLEEYFVSIFLLLFFTPFQEFLIFDLGRRGEESRGRIKG